MFAQTCDLEVKTSNLLVECTVVQSVQASEGDKEGFAGFAGFFQGLGIIGMPGRIRIARILLGINQATRNDRNGHHGGQAINQGHAFPPMVGNPWDVGASVFTLSYLQGV